MEKAEFTRRVLAAEPTLYRVSNSICHQAQDAEDAVQNAVLRAWQNCDKLKQPEYFATWLVRILIRECCALQRRRPITGLPPDETLLDPHTEHAYHRSELQEALTRLPQKLRLCLVLYYVEGYTVQEISRILQIPTGTVKSRLARGRTQLKVILFPEEEVNYGTI